MPKGLLLDFSSHFSLAKLLLVFLEFIFEKEEFPSELKM